ncbi:MAG: T9SS type A sorting domain-containing protein [Flavobacteriales bacterium]|nr:T9SS type A sorting domain-containing protein [Flavobacteriales bacterium]
MKKLLLFGISCALIGTSYSQNNNVLTPQNSATPTKVRLKAAKPVDQNVPTKGTVIWSEDFASGIPSGWTNTGTDLNGATMAAPWEYRGPFSNPNNTVGGRGGCASGDPISSTTANNGFVIFDSNFLDAANSPCGQGQGSGTGPAAHTGILTTGVIDLSNETSAILTFEYWLRNFSTNHTCEISDDGTNWTVVWADQVAGNAIGEGTVKVNISAWAGDTIWLRWVYAGEYYEWMLDDIGIETADEGDLATTELYFGIDQWGRDGGGTWFQIVDTVANGFYRRIPESQANNFEVKFGGLFDYWGSDTIPNPRVKMEVLGTGSMTYVQTLPSVMPSPGGLYLDKIDTSYFPDQGTGTYTFRCTFESDSADPVSTNNSQNKAMTVTDTVYQLDNEVIPQFVQRFWEGNKIGVRYDITTATTASSISMNFYEAGTQFVSQGAFVSFRIYDLAQILANPGASPIGKKDFAIIGPNHVSNSASAPVGTFPLESAVTLNPGSYLVTMEIEGDSIWTLGSEETVPDGYVWSWSDTQSSWFWEDSRDVPRIRLNLNQCASLKLNSQVANDGSGNITISPNGGTPPFTYLWSNGSTDQNQTGLLPDIYTVTMTDANGCELIKSFSIFPVSVDEINVDNISLYPNPSNGKLFFESSNESKYIMQVYDVAGKLVRELTISSAPGSRREIDLEELEKGTYMVNFMSLTGTEYRQKMIIE